MIGLWRKWWFGFVHGLNTGCRQMVEGCWIGDGDDFWLCTGEVGSRKNWFCFGHGDELIDLQW